MSTFPINVRRVLTIIGIIVLVFVVLEFNRRLEELNMLNEQADLYRTQATQVASTKMALQVAVTYANSTEAVDGWARANHEIKDGDLPMIPISVTGAAPIELSTPMPTPTAMQNWEVWWKLFFGK